MWKRSGIYQIRCKRSGRIYIGSAVNLLNRWYRHHQQLAEGLHGNPHLQSAWTRYGAANFEFTVLEFADPSQLLLREQYWIDRTGCADRRKGFNVKLLATTAGAGIGQTWSGFRNPNGDPVTIVNLSSFCRQNHLDFPSMRRLSKGVSRLKSYKGWTHTNSVRQREYIKTHAGFIDPEGRPVPPIRNLAEFCSRNGLNAAHMAAVANGRIVCDRGWTHALGRTRLPAKIHKGFVAPGGAVVRITNLAAFCRACGLTVVHMHELKSGKRPRHKGWTWKHDADRAFG
ncbi:MAG TPA: GIY-YIG nuclease family protein [Steroidobacteraceae bacterium]|nr:GIY-YIG nuclease family protein [Steroidobacteraceae bacterium]